MSEESKEERLVSALLILGVLYFSFMMLDRVLSVIYGFNFQPFGPYMPPGFTIWGHIFNASLFAVGLFLTFKLYDYGGARSKLLLQVLALGIVFTVGAIVPYMNDAAYIASRGMGNTVPFYVVAVDLYLFLWGLLVFRIAKPIWRRALVLGVAFSMFLVIHFAIYVPMFPEFYWS